MPGAGYIHGVASYAIERRRSDFMPLLVPHGIVFVGYTYNYGNDTIMQWNQHTPPNRRHLPKLGVDYPRNYAEFMAWFPDDAACVDYLDWLRWKVGFLCPTCHGSKGWRM